MTLAPLTRALGALASALLLLAAPACDSSPGTTTSTFPEVGQPYPAATVYDCAGNAVALRDWIAAYDVVYIGFAAQWCQACQEEAPILNAKLVDGLASENVGVLQLLVEALPGAPPTEALCASWRDDLGARYDVFVDVDQTSLDPHFGGAITDLPLHYIVSGDGTVRLRKLGALPDDIQQLVSDWIP